MQYHYVVGYDTDKKRWWVEFDPTAYFPDGNIWDDKLADETGYGWKVPEDGSAEEALDFELFRVLESCVPGILPGPKEV